ncbi:putative cephalosporin C regulator 1 [Xylariales sp. PMI_506]|nr:putative cephalosporin C regulator 1 [Xylariales sp. PMI_506]
MDSDSQPPESAVMAAQTHPRNRAPSRASTASIHSTATQPTLEQSFAAAHGSFPDQWSTNGHSQARDLTLAAHQMAAEEIMLRPASQMHAAQSFAMDSSMQSSVGHALSFSQHPALGHPGLSADSFGNASFTDPDSQMLDRDDNGDGDSLAGLTSNPKPSSNKSSANNELEMRALFQANNHRSLQDVASELHGNERGPNSERTRQVFAMLWINQVCSKGKGSVPRGRVYANYASRCATERTTVLNPASFGKLVRVLFPGLKTRRLGVRGESKYHYVNFTLTEDSPDIAEPIIQPAIPYQEPVAFAQTANHLKSQSPALNAAKTAMPSPDLSIRPNSGSGLSQTHNRAHSFYNQPDVSSLGQVQQTSAKTMLRLSLIPDDDEAFHLADSLVLPKIEPFLPENTDRDAAMSLTALYRSHCTSLVECIRYCREKTFFHLYTSFQGTLTMPVQKLFSNPSIAPWIEQCDFILYQRMMRIVSGLTLQVVPKPVLDTLRNISERLIPHIRDSFQGQPRHVVHAKEAPAAIFAGLLDRALRVNLTAHAAANMLSNPANRDQMYLDWITMVRIRKVAECVPTKGMDDVVDLLLDEIRDLLDPQNVPWDIECQTLYGDVATRNGHAPQTVTTEDDCGQNILDRWVNFLTKLPAKFPYATTEDIVCFVQIVGTAVMRDLTIAQGKSFGSWWVTKCWVDEMISFLAEQGGFIKQTSSVSQPVNPSSRPIPVKEADRQNQQVARRAEDFSALPSASRPGHNRAPFPSQVDKHSRDSLGMSANPDDSGIGMRTPEEDFPMDKFDLPQGHGHELQGIGLEQDFH